MVFVFRHTFIATIMIIRGAFVSGAWKMCEPILFFFFKLLFNKWEKKSFIIQASIHTHSPCVAVSSRIIWIYEQNTERASNVLDTVCHLRERASALIHSPNVHCVARVYSECEREHLLIANCFRVLLFRITRFLWFFRLGSAGNHHFCSSLVSHFIFSK